jgi:uncharacterized membrane protein
MSSFSSQQPDHSIERASGTSSSDTKEVRTTIQTIGYAYSGPLPPPMVLREFEDILPGSAERIFKQFEVQAEHRRRSETTVIASNAFTQKLGAVSAAVVGTGGMAGGI